MRFPWRFLAAMALVTGLWMMAFAWLRNLGQEAELSGLLLVGFGAAYLVRFAMLARSRGGR